MAAVEQASTDEGQARYGAQVQQALEEVVDKFPNFCDDHHCRIFAGLILNGIINSAHIETLERHATGE
jgi:hypothetical protein